jgi:hypothetical protein
MQQATRSVIPDNTGPDPNGRPLPPDQQQDPNSPVIRMPGAEAVQSWRDSVGAPQVIPPRPQPGPRSEVAPSPTGAANIPPVNVAGLGLGGPPQQPLPFAPTAAVQGAGDVISDAPPNEAVRNNITQRLAQNVFPPVTGGGAAILPGGYRPPAPTPAPAPPPQIRTAPPAQQTQRVPDTTAPALLPMVNDNIRRFDAIARDPRISEAGRAMAVERIKTEQAQIKATNDQTLLEYNDRRKIVESENTPSKMQERADAARAAELAATEAQQRIAKGKAPDRVTHEGQIYERQDNGTWKDVTPGGGDRAPKLTEGQAKDLGFYERGKRALADLGDGEKLNGWYEWYASGMPLIGNSLVSKEFQGQLNAAREFAAIVLRRESGAAVTDKELAQVLDRYLPKPGTDPETAIQKAYMREGQVQSFRDALGDKGAAADRFDKRFDVERQMLAVEKAKLAKGTKESGAADPLEGREAVWPDQTIRVRRNGQWVPK